LEWIKSNDKHDMKRILVFIKLGQAVTNYGFYKLQRTHSNGSKKEK
jgi:hypothetical protein